MLRKIILTILLLSNVLFASSDIVYDTSLVNSLSQNRSDVWDNFDIDIDLYSLFSLMDERFKQETLNPQKLYHNPDKTLLKLTYKF